MEVPVVTETDLFYEYCQGTCGDKRCESLCECVCIAEEQHTGMQAKGPCGVIHSFLWDSFLTSAATKKVDQPKGPLIQWS